MLGVVYLLHFSHSTTLAPTSLRCVVDQFFTVATTAPNTLVYILIFIPLLPVPISIRQSISSTLPDHPTGHTPQFRAYLILVICKRLWATCFICNRPICPSLLPFIIIKHDLTHRLGPPSSSASFLFFCSELDFLLYHVSVSLHCITCTPSIHYHASFTIVWESTYTILF